MCGERERGRNEAKRGMCNGHGDAEQKVFKVSFLDKFHFISTHSMIRADGELAKNFTDILFQLNTVREHDNHEVM